ncbi:MAG: shikimate dehydrogenase [Hyphomicrobiaceae bacterium]
MSETQRAACVIGYPAKHSRSPKLHRYWIEQYHLNADYRAEEIAPEHVEEFISNLSAHGYVGANITMPHKDIALALSQPDTRAKAVGAANTLWLEDGILRSTNTDVEGFLGALDAKSPGWDRRTSKAVVLGAGGAARAVVYGLIEREINSIHVVNRTTEKAEALRDRFGPSVHTATWNEVPQLLDGAHLLANATSLGMDGQPALKIDIGSMAKNAIVSDIVYVPLTTPLLEQAKARGLAISNGLDMLLYQAVRGFELWFGKRPEVTEEQYNLLARDIEAH